MKTKKVSVEIKANITEEMRTALAGKFHLLAHMLDRWNEFSPLFLRDRQFPSILADTQKLLGQVRSDSVKEFLDGKQLPISPDALKAVEEWARSVLKVDKKKKVTPDAVA